MSDFSAFAYEAIGQTEEKMTLRQVIAGLCLRLEDWLDRRGWLNRLSGWLEYQACGLDPDNEQFVTLSQMEEEARLDEYHEYLSKVAASPRRQPTIH
jgi:hypothetical protein